MWSMCMWVSTTSVTDARSMPAASSRWASCPARGKFKVRVVPQPGVDEDGLAAAAHHDHVQPPIELVRRQEIVVEPSLPDGLIGVVAQHLARQRQHSVADHHYVDIADLQRVARRNQLVGGRFDGV